LFGNRDYYKDKLACALKICRKGGETSFAMGGFWCDDDTPAYVNKTGAGPTIHLCKGFFNEPPDERPLTIIHEFGRRCGITGDKPKDEINNAHFWRDIVRILCKRYSQIVGNGRK